MRRRGWIGAAERRRCWRETGGNKWAVDSVQQLRMRGRRAVGECLCVQRIRRTGPRGEAAVKTGRAAGVDSCQRANTGQTSPWIVW